MLARLPDVPPGAKCDAKNGWLPDKFHDQCREIATIYISEEVQKQLFQDKLDKAAEDEGDSDDDVQIVEEDEGKENYGFLGTFAVLSFCCHYLSADVTFGTNVSKYV